MELPKITIKADFGDIRSVIRDLKSLQTYKMFDGEDEVYISLEDTINVLRNHIHTEVVGQEIRTPHRLETIFDYGEISIALRNVLARELNIRYDIDWRTFDIEQLSEYTRKEIMKFRNMGKMRMQELDAVMEKYGVKFLNED